MQTLLKLFVASGMIMLLTSCAKHVIVINRDIDVVRLGPDVYGTAHVYNIQTGQWEKTKKFHYPEGWYAGPMTVTNF